MTADPPTPTAPRGRGAYTLIEVMVVLTLMGVMIAMAAPSFRRAVEKANADIAVANLRAIWAAQRVYWIANRTYAADLPTLVGQDLVGPEVMSSSWPFHYALNPSGDTSFTVTALRSAPHTYTGQFTIDETGAITGSLTNPSDSTEPAITPPQTQ